MGEIAEMMLDGTLCEGCGVYLEREPTGFPGYCSEKCARDRGMTLEDNIPVPLKESTTCPRCRKRLKSISGLRQHLRDRHGER